MGILEVFLLCFEIAVMSVAGMAGAVLGVTIVVVPIGWASGFFKEFKR